VRRIGLGSNGVEEIDVSRISRASLDRAIGKVRAMDLKQKEQLADEVFRTQPHMLASLLVLSRFGVSMEKMEFAANVMLICFQAMKESGLTWPLITEDEQERQMERFTAIVRFSEDLGDSLRNLAVQQYMNEHPEKELFAYVQAETAIWLTQIAAEESDKFVILATANFVNCIAYVPMEVEQSVPGSRSRKSK
jgi:hypothetical protein